jgi:AraC family transcriptional activator of pobA
MPYRQNPKWRLSRKPNLHTFERGKRNEQIFFYDHLYSIIWLEYCGSVQINFEDYELNGSYLIFLCPGELFEVKESEKIKILTFPYDDYFSQNELPGMYFHSLRKIHKVRKDLRLKVISCITQLESKSNLNISKDHVFALLNCCSKAFPIKNTKDNQLIFRFIELVHRYYKEQHGVSFYAEKLFCTPKYLTEKFHKINFVSPHKIIRNRILLEAKRQLLLTNNTAFIICFDLGFNDPAYFSRFFKKNAGMRIKDFRSLYRRSSKLKNE